MVTPYVGVWIETCLWMLSVRLFMSHPTWVCGLKLLKKRINLLNLLSHPTWVCGLKHYLFSLPDQGQESHPTWVCGLKLKNVEYGKEKAMSHPTWVCGLKQWWGEHVYRQPVTPYVGVWIETSIIIFFKVRKSHTLRGCVDWNAMIFTIFVSSWQSHPTWVCGLKPPVPCYVPKV